MGKKLVSNIHTNPIAVILGTLSIQEIDLPKRFCVHISKERRVPIKNIQRYTRNYHMLIASIYLNYLKNGWRVNLFKQPIGIMDNYATNKLIKEKYKYPHNNSMKLENNIRNPQGQRDIYFLIEPSFGNRHKGGSRVRIQ